MFIYGAHCAVIFAIAQLSCMKIYVSRYRVSSWGGTYTYGLTHTRVYVRKIRHEYVGLIEMLCAISSYLCDRAKPSIGKIWGVRVPFWVDP